MLQCFEASGLIGASVKCYTLDDRTRYAMQFCVGRVTYDFQCFFSFTVGGGQ